MPKLFARLIELSLRPHRMGCVAVVARALPLACVAVLPGLVGCAAGRVVPVASSSQAGAAMRGRVHGGQQPVSGALVQLWAAGNSGNASAAAPLLTSAVYTDGGGGFDITGGYTCPSATTQVYLTATGGNPGLAAGVDNASLALMTALGDCGSLASVANISVNELTTVAAAYALAPFAGGVSQVGTTATNAAGLRSAMHTAMLLADSYTGNVPAASLPVNATVETAKLITLANVIGNCVNSDGTTACSTVGAHAGLTGVADTFQMALAVAQHPGDNVAALFNDAPAHAAFGGALATAPADWTMSISYTGGGMARPNAVAVDGQGNVWVSNRLGGVSGFSPLGVPMFASGVSDASLVQPAAITIDAAGDAWTTNSSPDIFHPNGSVVRVGQSGAVQSGSYGYTAGAISLPDSLAAAADGSMWVANAGSASVTLLSATGSALSGANGFGGGLLSGPAAIAVDGLGDVWVANRGSGLLVQIDAAGNILRQTNCCGAPDSLAIDRNGTLWAGDSSAGSLTEVRSDGVVVQTIQAANASNRTIAIDGGSHLFVPDAASGAIAMVYDSGFAAAGTRVGQTSGLGMDARLSGPAGAAADASGNLWVTSAGDNRLVSFVGLAAPVKTPKIGPPVQP